MNEQAVNKVARAICDADGDEMMDFDELRPRSIIRSLLIQQAQAAITAYEAEVVEPLRKQIEELREALERIEVEALYRDAGRTERMKDIAGKALANLARRDQQ